MAWRDVNIRFKSVPLFGTYQQLDLEGWFVVQVQFAIISCENCTVKH